MVRELYKQEKINTMCGQPHSIKEGDNEFNQDKTSLTINQGFFHWNAAPTQLDPMVKTGLDLMEKTQLDPMVKTQLDLMVKTGLDLLVKTQYQAIYWFLGMKLWTNELKFPRILLIDFSVKEASRTEEMFKPYFLNI